MASILNVKESKGFCDEVYAQLTSMRDKVLELRTRSSAGKPETDIDGGKFTRQLTELADMIEWKLQILSHSCSVDWKGSAEYEEIAEVDARGKSGDLEFSPGYVGG
jgi:hypothetical protein